MPRGQDLKRTESQKGSARTEGVHITEESVIDVNIAVFQRLCFWKYFNVLPQLEASVSKITNSPILFPSVPQEAHFFEVDGNWCGNHGDPGKAKISHL